MRSFREASIATKVLVLAVVAFAVMAVYRFVDFWLTGFYVSDEFGYFYDASHASIYSIRWFFGWLNILLFKALGITNATSFSYLLPVYIVFWAAVTLVLFNKIMRLCGFDDHTIALSTVASFVLIAFVLLSLGFLTEPVGLALAMLGIYFVLRFVKTKRLNELLIMPFASAVAFWIAAGTREPYNALLVGGTIVIGLLAYWKRNELFQTRRLSTRTVLVIAFLATALPSLLFIQLPFPAFAEQVAPLTSQISQVIVTNPQTILPVVTTTTTSTAIVTHVVGTVTTTSTTTVTATTTSVEASAVPWYGRSLILNTLVIFVGGVFLGWGPIAFILAAVGLVLVLRRVRSQEDLFPRTVLLLSLIALGSYFVVSFIFAPDPYYFTFSNYSTIIRFSDTALPAFFLLIPFAMRAVLRRRAFTMGFGVAIILFLIAFVPVYQTYASSNLAISTGNPFSLSYRTTAVDVRNYIDSHQSSGPFYVIGAPEGWTFTPGLVQSDFYPDVSLANFTQYRWSTFYIFSGADNASIHAEASYLVPIIEGGLSGTLPPPQAAYQVTSDSVALSGPGFLLTKVTVSWTPEG